MRKLGMRFRAHGALSSMAVFLMIGAFALMVFALTVLGAQGYRAVVEGASDNARERICRFYVVNKLRAAQGDVSIKTDSGIKSVCIEETGESLFITRIYCYEGSLMESYDEQGAAFDPALGERLCDAREMDVSIEGGLCAVTITAQDGSVYESCVALDRG